MRNQSGFDYVCSFLNQNLTLLCNFKHDVQINTIVKLIKTLNYKQSDYFCDKLMLLSRKIVKHHIFYIFMCLYMLLMASFMFYFM